MNEKNEKREACPEPPEISEKLIQPLNGIAILILDIVGWAAAVLLFIAGIAMDLPLFSAISVILFIISILILPGLHVVNPKEAIVLVLFGKYYGTIKKEGFYFTNPFAVVFNPSVKAAPEASRQAGAAAGAQESKSQPATTASRKISTKTMTLHNEKQKVNDEYGNPIIIATIVIWKVEDPTKAVFNVENFREYLSTQCDSVIRNVSRLYPYDTMEEDTDEKTLRGSSQEIADTMKEELQKRVDHAGLAIEEVRITHLSYAEEIAAAMLQRQQAVAIIAARQKIVEGAVSMVKMAIDQLGEEEIVLLDEERKAAMVSNLLVVLCGNKDAQPIVNTGNIYS